MKKRSKMLLRGLLALVCCIVVFFIWYDWTYSMDVVESYEINEPTAEHSILIATQGSTYKNEVTKLIVEDVGALDLFVKVIDVTKLSGEQAGQYDAYVIIHTIEMYKAPKPALDFAEKVPKSKLLGIATSGDGIYHMEGVDGVTSASVILDSRAHADEAVHWIKNQFKN